MTHPRTMQRLQATALIVMTLTASHVTLAQRPPPVQGTIALEGTMKKFYHGVNVLIVTTIDGIEHAYRLGSDLVVHGSKGPAAAALEGLQEGRTVVVHYDVQGREQTARELDVIGGEGLETTEGEVTRIDRRRGEITVRYGNGKTEVFRLTERAAAETQGVDPNDTKVIIYYADEHGQRVVHFFRRVPR